MKDRYHEHAIPIPRGEDIECPIMCGECCTDGQDYTCRHHSPQGCVLPRNKRPRICVEYLCKRAKEALEK